MSTPGPSSASPDRSRSPLFRQGHQCWVALTDEQTADIETRGTLLKAWFGNGRSIPVKDTVDYAVDAFQKANSGANPNWAVSFKLTFKMYCEWLRNHKMQAAPEWIHGYRIKDDVALSDLDPEWTFHDVTVVG